MTTQFAHAPVSLKTIPAFLRSSWLSWTTAFALCLSAALVGGAVDPMQIYASSADVGCSV